VLCHSHSVASHERDTATFQALALSTAYWLASRAMSGKSALGRRMPQEVHLVAVGDAAGVRLNPSLVRAENDPDLACPVTGVVAGRSAIVKARTDERRRAKPSALVNAG
jgi:hypothetical protein